MKKTFLILLRPDSNEKDINRSCRALAAQTLQQADWRIVEDGVALDMLFDEKFEGWVLMVSPPAYPLHYVAERIEAVWQKNRFAIASGMTRVVKKDAMRYSDESNARYAGVFAFCPSELRKRDIPHASQTDLQLALKLQDLVERLPFATGVVHETGNRIPQRAQPEHAPDPLGAWNGSRAVCSADTLELLSPSLLEQWPELTARFIKFAEAMDMRYVGWHYWLDFVWTATRLPCPPGSRILDAGGGGGLMQYWLAKAGFDVVSVDFNKRELPGLARQAISAWPGKLEFRQADLADLSFLENASFDAVIGISSLEHNEPDKLDIIARELLRVLKPGGVLMPTMSAANGPDWFHAPCKGWNYGEQSLVRHFKLNGHTANFGNYRDIFKSLRASQPLSDLLAPGYYCSGNNGMPWGIWNPTYQPVGICKIKK